jgi:hypothetical protein
MNESSNYKAAAPVIQSAEAHGETTRAARPAAKPPFGVSSSLRAHPYMAVAGLAAGLGLALAAGFLVASHRRPSVIDIVRDWF